MSIAALCANTTAGDICVHTDRAGEAGGREGEKKKKRCDSEEDLFDFPHLCHLQNRNSSGLSAGQRKTGYH